MARSSVVDRDLGYKALKEHLDDIKGSDAFARVGVFASGPGRTAEPAYQPGIQAIFEAAGLSKPAQEVTNVDLGVWHEFGIPELNIPERSWLRSAFDGNREKWFALAGKLAGQVIDGKLSVETALGRLGLRASSDVKLGITRGSGIPPPNAPSTIKQKGSSRPLVDSGQFVNSITWDVMTEGEGE